MFTVSQFAHHLPEAWDTIAGDNIFLKRNILTKLEELNPCSQLYHLNLPKNIAFVSYQLKIDIFTFCKYLSCKIPANIIGIPLSVAKSGYSIDDRSNVKALIEYVKSLKGFWLILNSNDHMQMARGNALPTCQMDVPWNSFQEYFASMRSHYRYRLLKAVKKFADVKVQELIDNKLFNLEMYKLYMEVYQRSNEKLEKLSIDFFKNFPATILTFTVETEVIAFVQLLENERTLFFLFAGFKHSLNREYDLYLNMLLQIIGYGIKTGARQIDFGQTTEETKLKLGAMQKPKCLYVHHSNPYINFVVDQLAAKFSYNHYPVSHRVFKGERDEGSTGKMP